MARQARAFIYHLVQSNCNQPGTQPQLKYTTKCNKMTKLHNNKSKQIENLANTFAHTDVPWTWT